MASPVVWGEFAEPPSSTAPPSGCRQAWFRDADAGAEARRRPRRHDDQVDAPDEDPGGGPIAATCGRISSVSARPRPDGGGGDRDRHRRGGAAGGGRGGRGRGATAGGGRGSGRGGAGRPARAAGRQARRSGGPRARRSDRCADTAEHATGAGLPAAAGAKRVWAQETQADAGDDERPRRARRSRAPWLRRPEVGGGGLAALHHHLVADLLVLVQALQAGLLHGGDVDEHVLAAVLRAMKPKPLVALNHFTVPVAMRRTLLV